MEFWGGDFQGGCVKSSQVFQDAKQTAKSAEPVGWSVVVASARGKEEQERETQQQRQEGNSRGQNQSQDQDPRQQQESDETQKRSWYGVGAVIDPHQGDGIKGI